MSVDTSTLSSCVFYPSLIFLANIPEDYDGSENPEDDAPPQPEEEDSDGSTPPLSKPSPSRTGLPVLVAESQLRYSIQEEAALSQTLERTIFISELSGYRLVVSKQLAAVSLHSLLGDQFSLSELMKLAKTPKPTVWSKLVQVMKPHKKVIKGTWVIV